MDEVTKRLMDHYRSTFGKHGATPEGVDWGPERDVLLRHHIMLNLVLQDPMTKQDKFTLLDVGCGFGGFLKYLLSERISVDYTGIDVVVEMVDFAKTEFNTAKFVSDDIFSFEPSKRFDYVTCNGLLTQKLNNTSNSEMISHARQLIKRMYSFCNRGIAFNIMSTKVNYRVDNLFYYDPAEIIRYCLSEVTNRIKIDHSYPLYEYTVYLYKAK